MVCDSEHSSWLTRVDDVVGLGRRRVTRQVEVSARKVDDKGAYRIADADTLPVGEDAFEL